MKKRSILVFFLLIVPVIAIAQTVEDSVTTLINIFDLIVELLMVVATAVFLWGVITYISASGDEAKIKSAKTYMLWGIVALFIISASWGIVRMLTITFSVGGEGTPFKPGDIW